MQVWCRVRKRLGQEVGTGDGATDPNWSLLWFKNIIEIH